jgi:hypothetical protein
MTYDKIMDTARPFKEVLPGQLFSDGVDGQVSQRLQYTLPTGENTIKITDCDCYLTGSLYRTAPDEEVFNIVPSSVMSLEEDGSISLGTNDDEGNFAYDLFDLECTIEGSYHRKSLSEGMQPVGVYDCLPKYEEDLKADIEFHKNLRGL